MSRFLVSTDTGGTFVDAIIWEIEKGRFVLGKAPSTPDDPPVGILAAVQVAAIAAGLSLDQVLAQTGLLFNGTTVTTNAMIERKGARTGLLITAGFEDTLGIANVIGRTAGLDEAQLLDYRRADPPPPIVPREEVRGVVERVDAQGKVLVPLQVEQAKQALDELVAGGIEALAICFLWSFRNPAHEQKVKEMAAAAYPELFTVASSDLIPILREYERANTTAINAFLGPVFESYARGLKQRVQEESHLQEPLIMQSVGGLAPATEIERVPITTLFSGPVGGVIGSQKLGKTIGVQNLITTDMGGTSFDVGLILDGEPLTTPTTVIERQIVAIPTVEIVAIGAGGGSVAKIDELGGVLQVGPESMGAAPGPACYSRGGETPTVTDADVILGYIDPDHFLGGNMKISRKLAETAVQKKIAKPLGMSVVEAAAAIYQIVNAGMADLIRRVTVEQGYDPRDFTLVAYGGCGPTHCTGYGPEIEARRIIIPDGATVFSALGISQSDLKHSLVLSFQQELRSADAQIREEPLEQLNAILAELGERGRKLLKRYGVAGGQGSLNFSADLRYKNQIHDLLVPLPRKPPLKLADLVSLSLEFERRYDQRYGKGASSPTARIECVNLRVDAVAPTPLPLKPKPHRAKSSRPEDALLGEKPVYNQRSRRYEPTPVYTAEKLQPGQQVKGSALIVSYGTTIPLHEGQRLEMDAHRNILIDFTV